MLCSFSYMKLMAAPTGKLIGSSLYFVFRFSARFRIIYCFWVGILSKREDCHLGETPWMLLFDIKWWSTVHLTKVSTQPNSKALCCCVSWEALILGRFRVHHTDKKLNALAPIRSNPLWSLNFSLPGISKWGHNIGLHCTIWVKCG